VALCAAGVRGAPAAKHDLKGAPLQPVADVQQAATTIARAWPHIAQLRDTRESRRAGKSRKEKLRPDNVIHSTDSIVNSEAAQKVASLAAKKAAQLTYCSQGYHVENNVCVACLPGFSRSPGDDPTGADTTCHHVFCGTESFVSAHTCVACPPGTVNSPGGDDASGDDTSCDSVACGSDEHVVNHLCVLCDPGSVNSPGGDEASGPDTECTGILCGANEYVSNHECFPCPQGHINPPGTDATGPDTTCLPVLCGTGEYVQDHTCFPCPLGMTNVPGEDDASQGDTECTPIICGTNHHVINHACFACNPGTDNVPGGDDASGDDTECSTMFCGTNEYVLNHVCTACATEETNEPGDDPGQGDTVCIQHGTEGTVIPGQTPPATVHGDPMFRYNGTGTHFWLKNGHMTPLLTWVTAEGRDMVLSGRTFESKWTGNQWFKQLVITQDGDVVLEASAKDTGSGKHSMKVKLDGYPVTTVSSADDVNMFSSQKANVKIGMYKEEGPPPEDKMNVEAGGFSLEVTSRRAAKYDSKYKQAKFHHLDTMFRHGLPPGAQGIYAEMAGVEPLSEATKAMLKNPTEFGAAAAEAEAERAEMAEGVKAKAVPQGAPAIQQQQELVQQIQMQQQQQQQR